MKVYTKAIRDAFNKRALEILSRFPKRPGEPGSYSHRFMSDLGMIRISIHPLEHGECTADVCTRIEDTEQFKTPEGQARAKALDICLPSGKWNVCTYGAEECLDIFEVRLKQVNARQPTDEEAAEWAQADEAEFQKYETFRNEWAAEKAARKTAAEASGESPLQPA